VYWAYKGDAAKENDITTTIAVTTQAEPYFSIGELSERSDLMTFFSCSKMHNGMTRFVAGASLQGQA
jgi:hypothetical protein